MTKAELKEWAPLCEEWDDLCRRIRELESKVAAGRFGMRIESSLRRLRSQRNVVNASIEKIEVAVDALPSLERQLIVLRYCEGCSWRKIALELGYSDTYVRGKLHKHALALLAGK